MRTKINYDELMQRISYDDLYNFYIIECNDLRSTCEHFGLTWKACRTLLKKYGIVKPRSQWHAAQAKTLLERYGDENYNNRDKMKQTKLNNHGCTNYVNSEKMKETKFNKYGVTCNLLLPDVKERALKNAHSEAANAKRKSTFLAKYGVECNYQTLEWHQKIKKHYEYDTESFDSFPELALYVYAIDHNEQIERCPCRLEYKVDGVTHYYFPDFRYNGQLVEIKGDHFFNEEGTMINPFDPSDKVMPAKYECMLANDVVVLTSKDYKKYVDYYNAKINNKII